jgi:hypothetical protein
MNNLEFIKFKKSNKKNKKYTAVLYNKATKRINNIHFGDKRYQHYIDSTGLDLYTHLNHFDEERRERYHKRHAKTAKKKYSPSYFSMRYLW